MIRGPYTIIQYTIERYIVHTHCEVKPPCVTTFRKQPPSISDRQSKTPKFPSQSLTVGTSRKEKQPPPVSNRDHFLGLMVKDFPLFLTSCMRPLDAFSDLDFGCVHYET